MSRTSRILAGASLGYVQMALAMAVGLWLTPFLLHRLGQHDFGVWSAALPVLLAVGLLDFGVIAILQRDVAFSLGAAGGDPGRATDLPDVIGRTLQLALLQMPLLVIAASLVWLRMPASWLPVRLPVGIVLCALVAGFPLRVYHAVLSGLQDLRFLGYLNIASWALGLTVTIALVLTGQGLMALALSWAASQLMIGVTCWMRARTRFTTCLPTRLPPLRWESARHSLGKGFWVILAQVAVALLSGSDLVVMAAVLGPAAVAPYAITGKLTNIFANVPQYIMASAQPALSELKTSSERGRLATVCQTLTLAVLLTSGLLTLLVLAVNAGFVTWWVDAGQFSGRLVTALLASNMILRHWSNSLTYSLFAFGHERRISLTTLADGLVTVGTAVALTRHFGPAGAALAGIVGVSTASIPANLLALAAETRLPVRSHLRALLPWTWRFVLLTGGWVWITHRWSAQSFLGLAATTSLAAASYIALMAPLLLRDPLGAYARPRIEALRLRLRRTA